MKQMNMPVQHALRSIDHTLARVGDGFPHITQDGFWQTTRDGSWTGGFWVGQLWWACKHTGQARYREAALTWMERLEPCVDAPTANFDLGFLFEPSFVQGYTLLGQKRLKDVALRAAKRLLTFYHPKAELIYTIYHDRSPRYRQKVGSAIVDIMMNLGLLWWAGNETGDPCFHSVARRHAERTADLHVRPDGSTFHVVDFDLDDGRILHRGTIHGAADDSTWARGQAWALHGFILAYQATGEKGFLETARQLAEFFVARVPADGLPAWDLDEPISPDTPRDASAAAIAAAGLLQLTDEKPLWTAGQRLLEALLEHSLTPETADGILAHATAYKQQGIGINEATAWGDYYLLQACDRLWAEMA